MRSPLADNEVVDIPFRWLEQVFLQIHSCQVADKTEESLSTMYPATQVYTTCHSHPNNGHLITVNIQVHTTGLLSLPCSPFYRVIETN